MSICLKPRKEEKAGGLSHPSLYNGSEASLGHLRSCLRNKQEKKLKLGLLGKTDWWLPLCELAKESQSKEFSQRQNRGRALDPCRSERILEKMETNSDKKVLSYTTFSKRVSHNKEKLHPLS